MNCENKKIYVVATAHLDTTWLWSLRTTIEKYLPETFNRNFSLFEKYPEYKFSFEGSYRYEMIEEYYPEAFAKIKEYVDKGRWFPAGSCYENGDVNTPSPEALLRNILYGTLYFKEKLGKTSNDIYLPDCFGFGAALPSVAAHAGLKGFTTGKLSWGSANGVPFDIGKWYGNDGSFIYATLKPGSYNRSFSSLRRLPEFKNKLSENIEKYALPITYTYHGTGDRGGSPSDASVDFVHGEYCQNAQSDTEIVPCSSSQLFDDLDALDEATKARLPEWHGELLMTAHGAGSYTSRAVGKRWNRRCEQLADAAERTAVSANWLRGYDYPRQAFEKAWKRVIAHHFHDDITGTSIQQCYKANWNDYVASMNSFAGEYTGAGSAIAGALDTSFCQGTPLIVSNPMQCEGVRTAAVSARIKWRRGEGFARVFDRNGNEVFSQVTSCKGGFMELVFLAEAPSMGFSVYDARASETPCPLSSSLHAEGRKAENSKLKIEINANGDISRIYDKVNSREALSSPVRLALLDDVKSKSWPAWEIAYKDVSRPVREFASNAKIELIENGAARAVFKITKTAGESVFTQLVSLDEDSGVVRVYNEVDWRTEKTLLKAVFHVTPSNVNASYDIGLGSVSRPNNIEKQYEVPAQLWADITSEDGSYGVSVFSDSRAGWDKPGSSILRLTCIHTPAESFRWECSQHLMDLGLNRFSFGIYPHSGDCTGETQQLAGEFNQPMNVFESDVHSGSLKSDFSFAEISSNSVVVRALKLAERTDRVIVRFNESTGKAQSGVHFSIGSGIEYAEEVNACEESIGGAALENGELVFDIGANCLKSFALTLKKCGLSAAPIKQTAIKLPFNACAITTNRGRQNATTANGLSLPAELLPDTLNVGGILFPICKDEGKNALFGDNQSKILPDASKKLHLLALCAKESKLRVLFDGKYAERIVPDSSEPVGAWDIIGLGETGYIVKDRLAFAATHAHSADADVVAAPLYVFEYTFDIPEGAVSFTLLPNERLYILSAVATREAHSFIPANELYDSLEKREFDYRLSADSLRRAEPTRLEAAVYEKIPTDSTKFIYGTKYSRGAQITDVFANLRSKLRFI